LSKRQLLMVSARDDACLRIMGLSQSSVLSVKPLVVIGLLSREAFEAGRTCRMSGCVLRFVALWPAGASFLNLTSMSRRGTATSGVGHGALPAGCGL
jgi:hypothetical protein